MLLEPSINTYTDAVWWAIVTSTTVGYGDISPETIIGRLIAVFLMIFGIGLLGLVTSSVASYFLKTTPKEENSTVIFLKSEIDRIEELSNQELQRVISLINSYREQKNDENM
jgi:voltage-gated potassium channel